VVHAYYGGYFGGSSYDLVAVLVHHLIDCVDQVAGQGVPRDDLGDFLDLARPSLPLL